MSYQFIKLFVPWENLTIKRWVNLVKCSLWVTTDTLVFGLSGRFLTMQRRSFSPSLLNDFYLSFLSSERKNSLFHCFWAGSKKCLTTRPCITDVIRANQSHLSHDNLLFREVSKLHLDDRRICRADLNLGTFAIFRGGVSKYGNVITRTRVTAYYHKKLQPHSAKWSDVIKICSSCWKIF